MARYNSDGSLDTNFDGDGRVITDFTANSIGYSVAIQADGKIVAAGYADPYLTLDFAVARYNKDGSLDHSFGGDGKVTTDFDEDDDKSYGVVVQADGKIVVAGYTKDDYDFALVRYSDQQQLYLPTLIKNKD